MIFPYSGPSHSPPRSSTEPLSLGKPGTRVLTQGAQEIGSPAPQHSPHRPLLSPSSLQPPFHRPARGVLQKRMAESQKLTKASHSFSLEARHGLRWPSRLPSCASPTATHRAAPCPAPATPPARASPLLQRHTVATALLRIQCSLPP